MAGMLMLALAFLLIAGWGESLTRLTAARDMTLAGMGMGLVFVPMLIAVQSAVPRAVLGSATSVTSFFRTIGGAIGVAARIARPALAAESTSESTTTRFRAVIRVSLHLSTGLSEPVGRPVSGQ
jgi:hypothetical protein